MATLTNLINVDEPPEPIAAPELALWREVLLCALDDLRRSEHLSRSARVWIESSSRDLGRMSRFHVSDLLSATAQRKRNRSADGLSGFNAGDLAKRTAMFPGSDKFRCDKGTQIVARTRGSGATLYLQNFTNICNLLCAATSWGGLDGVASTEVSCWTVLTRSSSFPGHYSVSKRDDGNNDKAKE
jgi:hypothetical protein